MLLPIPCAYSHTMSGRVFVFFDQLGHVLRGRVHDGNNVETAQCRRFVILASFIMDRPGRIGELDKIPHIHKILPHSRLITQ